MSDEDDAWAAVPPLDDGSDGPSYDDPPAPPHDEDQPLPPEFICAEFPLNDIGNGQRFTVHFGKDIIWVPRVGWFTWTGKRWSKDPDNIDVRRMAQKVSALIEMETHYITVPPARQSLVDQKAIIEGRITVLTEIKERTSEEAAELLEARTNMGEINRILEQVQDRIGQRLRHAKNAGNSGPINNMISEAGIGLSRQLEELDAEPLDVNTDTGVLRFSVVDDELAASFLKEGEKVPKVAVVNLLPHDRAQLLTKMVPVAYDPKATCPLFTAFMERVQPNIEIRQFLQRWFGLSMTALTGEQKLVFLHGAGANGKSVLVDLMARIMSDYSATAKIESLTGKSKRGGGDATPDLIPLVGARMVRTSEPEEGERLQEGLIKALTGGEPFMARGLHADFFEFLPVFKLTISGNHKPDIRGTDDGIWRRLLLVPFDVQIPKEERDPMLGVKLWEERAGILNWLIQGLKDYLDHGLQEPLEVLEATAEFREESDPIGAFLCDATVVSGHELDFMAAKDLIEAFNFWLDERGETRWGGRTISLKLKSKAGKWRHPASQRTFISGKSGVTGYRGIKLNDMFSVRFAERVRGGDRGNDRWEHN